VRRDGKGIMTGAAFWEAVGEMLARADFSDDDFRIFDTWYTLGESYRLAGREPAALVTEILAAKTVRLQ
jgi:hypothetical protein